MRDVFACSRCRSIYEIKRLQQQPLTQPRCQVCFASFPPNEMGHWLAYERAEPEWSLAEWLGVEVSQYSVDSPRRAFIDLAQKEIQATEPPLPSRRLQKAETFGSARIFDER